MIFDVQDLLSKILFSGRVPGYDRHNWFDFNGNSSYRTLQVDKTRANASRVSKVWHINFRAWIEEQMEVEARRSWVRSIDLGLKMCNFVSLDQFDYHDKETVGYTVFFKKEPLFSIHFICREGKGKKKKGLSEVVAVYGLLSEYRRMHGVKKTAAKKQENKTKKKIIGVPDQAYLNPHSRSAKDSDELAVWTLAMKEELLDWFGEQHARMVKAF